MNRDEEGLDRFVSAQARDFETALSEIQGGRKRSHWMWYIFPQIRGLGMSSTAQYYGIRDLDEARGYLLHPVLGANLRRICGALLALRGSDATALLGYPDDLKLCSCMTLFEAAAPEEPIFGRVLDKYYRGARDRWTMQLLAERS